MAQQISLSREQCRNYGADGDCGTQQRRLVGHHREHGKRKAGRPEAINANRLSF
jgi:hypothetical protein